MFCREKRSCLVSVDCLVTLDGNEYYPAILGGFSWLWTQNMSLPTSVATTLKVETSSFEDRFCGSFFELSCFQVSI